MNTVKTNQVRVPQMMTKKMEDELSRIITMNQLKAEKLRIRQTLLAVAADHYEVSIEELKNLIIQDWVSKLLRYPVVPGAGKAYEPSAGSQFKPVCADLNEEN